MMALRAKKKAQYRAEDSDAEEDIPEEKKPVLKSEMKNGHTNNTNNTHNDISSIEKEKQNILTPEPETAGVVVMSKEFSEININNNNINMKDKSNLADEMKPNQNLSQNLNPNPEKISENVGMNNEINIPKVPTSKEELVNNNDFYSRKK
jgi:hypothetical protein